VSYLPKAFERHADSERNSLVRELSCAEIDAVAGGGHKHLAGVKYEDITINCGTVPPSSSP
jgi:hypothetical protein